QVHRSGGAQPRPGARDRDAAARWAGGRVGAPPGACDGGVSGGSALAPWAEPCPPRWGQENIVRSLAPCAGILYRSPTSGPRRHCVRRPMLYDPPSAMSSVQGINQRIVDRLLAEKRIGQDDRARAIDYANRHKGRVEDALIDLEILAE